MLASYGNKVQDEPQPLSIWRPLVPYNQKLADGLWQCGHPRTVENSIGFQIKYGCRMCGAAAKRERYYRSRGYEKPPLPLAYRNALRGFVRKWTNVGGAYIHERVRKALAEAEPLTRVCYLMTVFHHRQPDEIGGWLGISQGEVLSRKQSMAEALNRTEHQDMYKDWTLVQQLIDEGVGEADVKEMIHISDAGWNAAKRRGDVRV